MPAGSGICVGGIILLNVLRVNDTKDTVTAFIGLLQIGLGVPFFTGFLFGQCGRKSKIDDFKATLPVSNSRLSAMILRPGAASLLSALAIYLAGLLLMIGWFFLVGEGETATQGWHVAVNAVHDEFGSGNTLLLVAVGIVIAWGLVGLGASLTFTGRPWVVWGFSLVICSVGPIVIGALAHAVHFCWMHVAYKIGPRTIHHCTGGWIARAAGGASGYRPIGTGMESTQVTSAPPWNRFRLMYGASAVCPQIERCRKRALL
jgi:hypothetical protein